MDELYEVDQVTVYPPPTRDEYNRETPGISQALKCRYIKKTKRFSGISGMAAGKTKLESENILASGYLYIFGPTVITTEHTVDIAGEIHLVIAVERNRDFGQEINKVWIQ